MSVCQADQLPFETVGGGKDTQRQVLIGSQQSPHFAMRRFIMQPGGGIAIHDFVDALKADKLTAIHLQRDTVRKVR